MPPAGCMRLGAAGRAEGSRSVALHRQHAETLCGCVSLYTVQQSYQSPGWSKLGWPAHRLSGCNKPCNKVCDKVCNKQDNGVHGVLRWRREPQVCSAAAHGMARSIDRARSVAKWTNLHSQAGPVKPSQVTQSNQSTRDDSARARRTRRAPAAAAG